MRRDLWSCVLVIAGLLVATACGDDGGSSGSDGADGAGDTTEEGATGEGAPEAGGEILLLSYNVAGLPQIVSEANPEENLPRISRRLEPYDIVLTQELFDWWAPEVEELQPDFPEYQERLRAEATHEHRTDQHPGPEAVGIGSELDRDRPFVGDGLGVLSRIPFDDVERVPWTECFGGLDTSDGGAGDCLSMKGFMVGTFTLDDGAEIDIYNLHGEAGSTDDDVRIRAENFEQLTEFMQERSADRTVIVAGDMNLHLEPDHERADIDEPVWTGFLEDNELTDVCEVVECDLPGAIDKAAFRNGGAVEVEPLEQRFATDDFQTGDGEDLSDHPPLEVRFAWRAP